MSDIATIAGDFKGKFYDAIVKLMAGDPNTEKVQVRFGAPTGMHENDIVAFMGLDTDQSPATLSTNRSREDVIELDVYISCFKRGGIEAERPASDRAYELLRLIERYVRMTDTTVGGSVRQCFLTRTTSNGFTPKELAAHGRNIQIVATFEAKARVTA